MGRHSIDMGGCLGSPANMNNPNKYGQPGAYGGYPQQGYGAPGGYPNHFQPNYGGKVSEAIRCLNVVSSCEMFHMDYINGLFVFP